MTERTMEVTNTTRRPEVSTTEIDPSIQQFADPKNALGLESEQTATTPSLPVEIATKSAKEDSSEPGTATIRIRRDASDTSSITETLDRGSETTTSFKSTPPKSELATSFMPSTRDFTIPITPDSSESMNTEKPYNSLDGIKSTPVENSYSVSPSNESLETTMDGTATPRTTPEPEIIALPKVTVFLGAQASQNGLTNTFAVAGLTLSETYLQGMLQRFPHCNNEDTCYLLDDAAFVMAVNKERLNYQVGYFLGYVDPPLMESLLENSVYSRVKSYDYQAVCDSAHLGEKNCTSPANRLIPNFLRSLAQIFYPHFWLSLLKHIASVVIKLTNTLLVFAQMCLHAFAIEQGIDYVNCVKSTYRYYPTDGANFRKTPIDSAETTGTFTCSPDCSRRWWATSIPETNLKLIKTDKICACIKKDYDWQLTPSIANDISICHSVPNPRYRRAIHACDA